MFGRSMFALYSVLICLITEKPPKMNNSIKYCCAFFPVPASFRTGDDNSLFSSFNSDSLYSDLQNVLCNVCFVCVCVV